MASGFYTWSQTAATNASADSSIGWAEGMAPAGVNDSARAMMAIMAKWRDDWCGVKPSNAEMITAGSANAQTLTTNGSISPAALTNGWTLTFKVGTGLTNTGAVTLAVDSLAAKPVQKIAGTALGAGQLQEGALYSVTYKQPSDAWIVHRVVGEATPTEFDSGTRIVFQQTAAPTGWTKDTTAGMNNTALRLVTGTVSNGGSLDFTTAFAARTIAQANLPNVNLSSANLTCALAGGSITNGSRVAYACNASPTNVQSGSGVSNVPYGVSVGDLTLNLPTTDVNGTVPLGGSGTALSFAVKYYDCVVAQKD